jgi:hypothetical protein
MRLVYFPSSIIPSTLANSVHVMRMSNAFSEIGNRVLLIAVSSKEDKAHIFPQLC